MFPLVTAAQIRAAEEEFFAKNPDVFLMGVAAEAVAGKAARMITKLQDDEEINFDKLAGKKVLVVAGPGNNGGDGLYAAALLAETYLSVDVVVALAKCDETGLGKALAAGANQVSMIDATANLASYDLVIDAVFGIGSRPGLPKPVADLAAECADLAIPVLSVDIPSGLDSDSCLDAQSFTATETLTFISTKPCHYLQPAVSKSGIITSCNIGVEIPASDIWVLDTVDMASKWPWPSPASDKYSRGVVEILAGSEKYPGAGVLATMGALYSGAGMVRFAGGETSGKIIQSKMPSVVFGHGRSTVQLLGSGWEHYIGSPENAARVEQSLAEGIPLVLDAGALPKIVDETGQFLPGVTKYSNCLFTPHAGELAQMLGVDRSEVEADPIGMASMVADRTLATVLLKGASNICVMPRTAHQKLPAGSPRVLVAISGTHWSAQAGSGDVVAGICATLLAAGLPSVWAGAMAASIHAATVNKLDGPYPPDQVAQKLPAMVAQLAKSASKVNLVS